MAHPPFTSMPSVQASCAICGAPAYPNECPHEGQRLELALHQAHQRWIEKHDGIRDWVLMHARNQIMATFSQLRSVRESQYQSHVQRLPYYSLYNQYHGAPPLSAHDLHILHTQFAQAQDILRKQMDEDWRQSCLKYPEVLDYYFRLVKVEVPGNEDERVKHPRFGGGEQVPVPVREQRRVGEREHHERERKREHRKSGAHVHGKRRDSRGATPPPPRAPSPGDYHHRR